MNKYFETVNAGDWETWLTLFDNNVVMDEQLAGRIEGVEKLRGGIAGLKKGYSRFQNHPLHVVVEGNKASVVWHIEAANASGVPIDAKGTNYFQIENGKITYMANFHDTVPFNPFVKQQLG
ncbi:MAG: nuclear transport factor 2 family protein [Chroococcidiopsis sp.]